MGLFIYGSQNDEIHAVYLLTDSNDYLLHEVYFSLVVFLLLVRCSSITDVDLYYKSPSPPKSLLPPPDPAH